MLLKVSLSPIQFFALWTGAPTSDTSSRSGHDSDCAISEVHLVVVMEEEKMSEHRHLAWQGFEAVKAA